MNIINLKEEKKKKGARNQDKGLDGLRALRAPSTQHTNVGDVVGGSQRKRLYYYTESSTIRLTKQFSMVTMLYSSRVQILASQEV